MHRLVARFRQIDDRQAPKAETAALLVENQFSSIVRPAMRHHIAHRSQQLAPDIAARCSVFPNSADAAHDEICSAVSEHGEVETGSFAQLYSYNPDATATGSVT